MSVARAEAEEFTHQVSEQKQWNCQQHKHAKQQAAEEKPVGNGVSACAAAWSCRAQEACDLLAFPRYTGLFATRIIVLPA